MRRRIHHALLAASACAVLACGSGDDEARLEAARAGAARHDVPEAVWLEMLESEELLIALGPQLRELSRSIRNLQLPDAGAQRTFDAVVEGVDLADTPWPEGEASGLPFRVRRLRAGAGIAPTSPHALDLWRPLFDGLDEVEWAKFSILRGRFSDEERRRFDTRLRLAARGTLPNGADVSIHGPVDLTWRRVGSESEDGAWRIARIVTGELQLQEVGRPLFREVLAEVVPNAEMLRRARHSEHEALVLRYLRDPEAFRPPTEHFHLPSHDRHPGIAVADVDGNGWDDLYVMPRWGRNQLFLNDAGRFEERAADFGLDLEDHASSALFADFDDDGDLDAFVGRTLAPSVYLENDGGRFEARPNALLSGRMPELVASLSAADVNGDGRLDLYASTYAANILVRQVKGRTNLARQGGPKPDRALEDFLDAADAKALWEKASTATAHEYLALPGPPNVLLWNRGGGRFEPAGSGHPLRSFANTYQATWADWDGDGDPDVYLAHDFSPNQLFRNEGEAGFTDVTTETGTADIGFGMGVTWGDYDRDGREDLYVTNMYSKAGRRITGFFDSMNPSFRKMARGNTLFRNEGAAFRARSGDGPDELPVEIAGWSWGGQFADFDNDGFLDLYALSGYYTAPPEVEALVDI